MHWSNRLPITYQIAQKMILVCKANKYFSLLSFVKYSKARSADLIPHRSLSQPLTTVKILAFARMIICRIGFYSKTLVATL